VSIGITTKEKQRWVNLHWEILIISQNIVAMCGKSNNQNFLNSKTIDGLFITETCYPNLTHLWYLHTNTCTIVKINYNFFNFLSYKFQVTSINTSDAASQITLCFCSERHSVNSVCWNRVYGKDFEVLMFNEYCACLCEFSRLKRNYSVIPCT
jgi:hypothetical protein